MTIDPTTLHGRTLGSLTVEELEACPEGAFLDLEVADDNLTKSGGQWWSDGERPRSSERVKECASPSRVLVIPVTAPTPKPPVYAVGRFVVMPMTDGACAIRVSDIHTVGALSDGGTKIVRFINGTVEAMRTAASFDALLRAIAHAEGR